MAGPLSSLRKSSNGRYKSLQGLYNPRPGGPYRGPSRRPMFRSKLEWRLMLMLDSPNATNVVGWEYESRRIPYVDRSTKTLDRNGVPRSPTRNYVVDFVVQLRRPDGTLRKFWIEVKSVHDIQVAKRRRNTDSARIAEKIRVKNLCKWMAAAKAARLNDAHFMVLTENELGTLSSMLSR